MKSRIWLLVVVGFGALAALILVSEVVFYRYAVSVQAQMDGIEAEYRVRSHTLEDLRYNILLLALDLRDYLVGISPNSEREQASQMYRLHDSILQSLAETQKLMAADEPARVQQLLAGFDTYWGAVQTVLELSPEQKEARTAAYMKLRSLGTRESLSRLTKEIDDIVAAAARDRQTSLRESVVNIRTNRTAMLVVGGVLSLLIAAFMVVKLRSLEQGGEGYRRQIEHDAAELRRLSRQLVKAQEDERKSISRELHDHVGQMLTALKMELGGLQDELNGSGGMETAKMEAANKFVDEILQNVRDMARGLRPAMLDELGLVSALQWQAREFSRLTGIAVNLQAGGNVDSVPEAYRTCVYRVVQEALTNCAKHAQASTVDVALGGSKDRLILLIRDDGVGLERQGNQKRGLGLLDIEERARELGGSLSVTSGPWKGVSLRIELPLPQELKT